MNPQRFEPQDIHDPMADTWALLNALHDCKTVTAHCKRVAAGEGSMQEPALVKHATECAYCYLTLCGMRDGPFEVPAAGRAFLEPFDEVLELKRKQVLGEERRRKPVEGPSPSSEREPFSEPSFEVSFSEAGELVFEGTIVFEREAELVHLGGNVGEGKSGEARTLLLRMGPVDADFAALRAEFERLYRAKVLPESDSARADFLEVGEAVTLADGSEEGDEALRVVREDLRDEDLRKSPYLLVMVEPTEFRLVQPLREDPVSIAESLIEAVLRYRYDPLDGIAPAREQAFRSKWSIEVRTVERERGTP